MSDNFYTLDPIDQQVALAYAQTLFAEWLKNNRPVGPLGCPPRQPSPNSLIAASRLRRTSAIRVPDVS